MSDTDAGGQQTLTGEEADARRRPSTLLYCEVCESAVLRSRRSEHEHNLSDAPKAEEAVREEILDDLDAHEDELQETQMFEVTFRYEYRERVVVEASHKSEAKERAAHEQQFARGGELVQTTHTEKRELTDASAPTLDYLEDHSFLPEDHDITQSDIERVMAE
ncbi:hypothetical protein [Halobacterium hubeiense]|uniref:hypothetical protein n=1 Tax=Halobacterium hubeiense TaxID=1407499 RepID=UPI003C74E7E7